MRIEEQYLHFLKAELKTENIFNDYMFCNKLIQPLTGKKRKWKSDVALLDWKIIIEIEGGVYSNGRHTRGSGYSGDCEKYTEATCLGWLVLRYTTEQAQNFDNVLNDVNRCINVRQEVKNNIKHKMFGDNFNLCEPYETTIQEIIKDIDEA